MVQFCPKAVIIIFSGIFILLAIAWLPCLLRLPWKKNVLLEYSPQSYPPRIFFRVLSSSNILHSTILLEYSPESYPPRIFSTVLSSSNFLHSPILLEYSPELYPPQMFSTVLCSSNILYSPVLLDYSPASYRRCVLISANPIKNFQPS
jgi:hypothetical protein